MMAIPPELNFDSEDSFTQSFMIPLLQKLGFTLVVNYHSTAEFGKDLIFAEVDRFGHIRYHGLQAKYVPSISLDAIEDLIRDAKQAFENPFIHPQTGASEIISSFYAVTGGSIGPEATQHYFKSLTKQYGSNVRLLQAKDLLILDRWASAAQRDRIVESLSGLAIELNYNERHIIPEVLNALKKMLDGTGAFPTWRLRTNAASAYLTHPFLLTTINADAILNYWHLAMLCNRQADLVGQGILSPESRKELTQNTIRNFETLHAAGATIHADVAKAMQTLGPLNLGVTSVREA